MAPDPDPTEFPEADEVAVAAELALFEPNPKRHYMVIPRNARDSQNTGLAELVIRKQIEQLVQLNEGQPYTFDRVTPTEGAWVPTGTQVLRRMTVETESLPRM